MKKSFICVWLILMIVAACNQKPETSSESFSARMRVSTSPVIRTDMADTVRIYGKTHLRYQSLLASQFDGRLSGFSLLMGDRVVKDQQIGEIIPAQREALLQALPKIDPAVRPGLLKQIKTIPLVSPISGTILEVFRHSGDVLQKGEPIVQIGDLSVLDVVGALPLNAMPAARKLQKIRVAFIDFPHPDLSLPVAAIAGKVDADKQTVPVRLTLKNPDGVFRPGMAVQLYFPGEIHRNALTMPRDALLEQEGIYSVFVLKGARVHKRIIKVGIKQNNRIEVLSDLREGERVVTRKAYSLIDGMEVTAE